MKDKPTIFESLLKKKVCFAVSVSLNSFINPKVKDTSKDYFLIALTSDFNKLKALKFRHNSDNALILERDLSKKEIIEFKANSDRFIKVLHTKEGRVYELVGNSFQEAYEAVKLETITN